MKQDYARTIGYLALLILFVQILPFGPLFRVIATAVCSFILIGIAFSISNLSRTERAEMKKEEPSKPKFEKVEQVIMEERPEEIVVIEEVEVETPGENYEER